VNSYLLGRRLYGAKSQEGKHYRFSEICVKTDQTVEFMKKVYIKPETNEQIDARRIFPEMSRH
jgi:hypothetical protein